MMTEYFRYMLLDDEQIQAYNRERKDELQWKTDGLTHKTYPNSLVTYIITPSDKVKGKFDLYARDVGILTDDIGVDLATAKRMANNHYQQWSSEFLRAFAEKMKIIPTA